MLRVSLYSGQVSVIVYSADMAAPPSCYELTAATVENIDYLITFIQNSREREAPPNTGSVLAKAVETLNGTDLNGQSEEYDV